MTNEQILEKQVEALEKLLQLRAAVIEELESKVVKLQGEVAALSPTTYGGGPGWYNPQPYYYPHVGGWGITGGTGAGGVSVTSGGLTTVSTSNTCPDGSLHSHPTHGGTCTKCGQYVISITGISGSQQQSVSLVAQPQDDVLTLSNAAK